MTDVSFKEHIYKPFLDAWKIIKSLQHAGEDGFKEEQAGEYWKLIDKFTKDYQDNEFAMFLRTSMLLHVDTIIIQLNERESK